MAHLLVLKGINAKQNISLDKDRVVLGRNASCDIVFPANDFAVSREHACILRVQSKYFIEDMGSRNGTYVNNQPVSARVQLKDNDKIRICDFLYSFHETVEAPKPPLPNEYRSEQTIDDSEGLSAFEASISNTSQVFLETQPAEKLLVIMDITNNLSQTLQLDPLLPKIVDSLFQLFRQADRGFIILREEITDKGKAIERLLPKVIKTRRGNDDGTASYSRSIVRECLKTSQAFLSDDAAADSRFNMSQSIADFRIRSVMCAPLWSQDTNKAFGVIQLDTQDRSKKFTQEDLNLLMSVAKQASVALENARMHESLVARERIQQSLELAHQVQLSFLPRQLPRVSGYEFSAQYEPAQQVGGDYYGFIPLDKNQRLAIMLGDVAGKGVPAALLMAKLSSDARFCLLTEADPAKAIKALNDLLCANLGQMDRFVTLAAAVLDLTAHSVTFVNAGHPSPLLIRRGSKELLEVTNRQVVGLPLGVMEEYPYESCQVQIEPGDCLVIFSDGVTEAMDKQDQQLNLRAIQSAVQEGAQTPRALGDKVLRNVKQFSAGRPQHDDITLVCFGRST